MKMIFTLLAALINSATFILTKQEKLIIALHRKIAHFCM